MVDARDVAKVLGGPAALGRRVRGFADLAAAVKEGLPTVAMRTLATLTQTSSKEISESVRIPARTLMRLQKRERLPSDESDKVYRLAHVIATARKVFQDDKKAQGWLREPNVALGGATPLSLLDSEPGARQVENILGRIAYGEIS